MRRMNARVIILCILAMLLGFTGVRLARSVAEHRALQGTGMGKTCAELLSAQDVRQACPAAAGRERLRVDAVLDNFPTLSKCGMSITARGAYTFYVSVDIFHDAASALARFRARTKHAVNDLIIAPGNELGFGEASAFHHLFAAPELDFQRDHVYVEIVPSGGLLCTDDDLRTLGRLLYERVARFKPHQ